MKKNILTSCAVVLFFGVFNSSFGIEKECCYARVQKGEMVDYRSFFARFLDPKRLEKNTSEELVEVLCYLDDRHSYFEEVEDCNLLCCDFPHKEMADLYKGSVECAIATLKKLKASGAVDLGALENLRITIRKEKVIFAQKSILKMEALD